MSMRAAIDAARAEYTNTVRAALASVGEDTIIVARNQLRGTIAGLLCTQYPQAPGDELEAMITSYLDALAQPQLHAPSVQTRVAMISKTGAQWVAAIVRAERANADERVRAAESAGQRRLDALKAALRARDLLSDAMLSQLFRSPL